MFNWTITQWQKDQWRTDVYFVMHVLLIILLVIILPILASIVHGAESDLPDPMTSKTPAQKIVEKFIVYMFSQDFGNAAKLSINASDPEVFRYNVSILKGGYDKEVLHFRQFYQKALFQSRWLEPQTLHFRKPLESDKEIRISVEFTERHIVIMPSGEKWQYFWRVGYLFILNDKNEIINVSLTKDEDKPLMVLKPENCIKPAICD